MSKKKSHHLLIPGPEGWELWHQGVCVERFDERFASALPKAPPTPFVMAFPVREATALPMVVPATDEDLLGDLVEMHYERVGLSPDRAAGKLDDYFIVGQGAENSAVLAMVLRAQTERDMPRRSAEHFDLSARVFRPEEDGIYLWMEFGRWVFAVYLDGELLYFQALQATELTADVARELQMALLQLEMQGLLSGELPVVVWSEAASIDELGQPLSRPVSIKSKPAPLELDEWSHLLPADVAAERRSQRKRVQVGALGALLGLALLMGGVLLGKDFLSQRKTLDRLQAQAEQLDPAAKEAELLLAKELELKPLIDASMWPQEVLLECAKSLPPGRAVRFKKFDVIPNGQGIPSQVEIQGEARDFEATTQFERSVRQNRSLKERYEFEMPTPQQDRNGLWSFKWILNNKSLAEAP